EREKSVRRSRKSAQQIPAILCNPCAKHGFCAASQIPNASSAPCARLVRRRSSGPVEPEQRALARRLDRYWHFSEVAPVVIGGAHGSKADSVKPSIGMFMS